MSHRMHTATLRKKVYVIERSGGKEEIAREGDLKKISYLGSMPRSMWYNIIWSVAFIICLALCIHQTTDRIQKYLHNPVISKVSVTRNSTFLYPLITICGHLKGGTSEMIKYLVERNWDCTDPRSRKFWAPLDANLTEVWKNANISQDLSYDAKFINPDGQSVKVIRSELWTIFGVCTTLSLGVPVKPTSPNRFVFRLSFGNLKECCSKPRILVHSNPYSAKTFYLETSSLKLRSFVTARLVLSAKQFKLINSSTSPCLDENDVYKCIHECVLNSVANQSTCRMPFLNSNPRFTHLQECTKTNTQGYSFFLDKFRQINPEDCNCGKICNEVLYASSLFIDGKKDNETKVTVQVPDTNIETVEEMPSYDLISLLCDIGGNLSLYMGVCLLSLLDFAQYIGRVISNSACFNNKIQSSKING